MRRLVTLICIALAFVSCGKQGKYHIVGTCKGAYDGDIITLSYSNDGRHLHEISKCEIKDEKFFFEGYTKDCKICYIADESLQSPQHVMFFLEEGDMTATFTGTDSHISGTKTNDLYNATTDSVEWYIEEMERVESKIVHSAADSATIDSLSLAAYNIQHGLTEFIRRSVKDNIKNLLGLYMLVVYNEFFEPEEIRTLIGQIPETSIDRMNNTLYDLIVEIESIRNRNESFEDIFFGL